jgi:hypothetical protein
MFVQSGDTLLDWMEDTGCNANLIHCLEEYLPINREEGMTLIAAARSISTFETMGL